MVRSDARLAAWIFWRLKRRKIATFIEFADGNTEYVRCRASCFLGCALSNSDPSERFRSCRKKKGECEKQVAAPGDKVKGIELRGAFCMSGSGLSFINVTT